MITEGFSLNYYLSWTVNIYVLGNSLANVANENLYSVLILFDKLRIC